MSNTVEIAKLMIDWKEIDPERRSESARLNRPINDTVL